MLRIGRVRSFQTKSSSKAATCGGRDSVREDMYDTRRRGVYRPAISSYRLANEKRPRTLTTLAEIVGLGSVSAPGLAGLG